MERRVLRKDQWKRIKDLLPDKSTDCGVTAVNNRQFIEAVLWIARTGAPWRDLPEKLGYWHRVYVRYHRWSAKGVWDRLFQKIKHFRRIATRCERLGGNYQAMLSLVASVIWLA